MVGLGVYYTFLNPDLGSTGLGLLLFSGGLLGLHAPNLDHFGVLRSLFPFRAIKSRDEAAECRGVCLFLQNPNASSVTAQIQFVIYVHHCVRSILIK